MHIKRRTPRGSAETVTMASGEDAASGASDADNDDEHPDINGGRKARNPMSAISGVEFERKVNAAGLRYLRELVSLMIRARKANFGKDTQLSMSMMVVAKYHRDGAMRVRQPHAPCTMHTHAKLPMPTTGSTFNFT